MVQVEDLLERGEVEAGRLEREAGGGAASPGLLRLRRASRSELDSQDLCRKDQVCSAGSNDMTSSGAAMGFRGCIPRNVCH